jgi:hypothetical protein
MADGSPDARLILRALKFGDQRPPAPLEWRMPWPVDGWDRMI